MKSPRWAKGMLKDGHFQSERAALHARPQKTGAWQALPANSANRGRSPNRLARMAVRQELSGCCALAMCVPDQRADTGAHGQLLALVDASRRELGDRLYC